MRVGGFEQAKLEVLLRCDLWWWTPSYSSSAQAGFSVSTYYVGTEHCAPDSHAHPGDCMPILLTIGAQRTASAHAPAKRHEQNPACMIRTKKGRQACGENDAPSTVHDMLGRRPVARAKTVFHLCDAVK